MDGRIESVMPEGLGWAALRRRLGENPLALAFLPISAVVTAYFCFWVGLVVGGWLLDGMPRAKLHFHTIAYYVVYASFPLLLVVWRVGLDMDGKHAELARRVAATIREELGRRRGRVLAVLAVMCLMLLLETTLVTIGNERVRYYADVPRPLFPIESPLPYLLGDLLSQVLSVDAVSGVIEALGTLALWLFVVHVVKPRGRSVLAFFLFAMVHPQVWLSQAYGNFEWSCAVLGTVGIYAVLRGRLVEAAALIAMATAVRFNGLFFGVVAAVVVLFRLATGRLGWRALPVRELVACILFAALNVMGIFYYIFVIRGGPGYLLNGGEGTAASVAVFFLTSLAENSPVLLAAGVAGCFLDRRFWPFALAMAGLLGLRSFSSATDGYHYVALFLPGLIILGAAGVQVLADKLPARVGTVLLPALLLVGAAVMGGQSVRMWWQMPWNKLSGQFYNILADLRALPRQPAVIIQTNFSVRPYLPDVLARGTKVEILQSGSPVSAGEQLDRWLAKPSNCVLVIGSANAVGVVPAEVFDRRGFRSDVISHELPNFQVLGSGGCRP